jgi:hypothetical protein
VAWQCRAIAASSCSQERRGRQHLNENVRAIFTQGLQMGSIDLRRASRPQAWPACSQIGCFKAVQATTLPAVQVRADGGWRVIPHAGARSVLLLESSSRKACCTVQPCSQLPTHTAAPGSCCRATASSFSPATAPARLDKHNHKAQAAGPHAIGANFPANLSYSPLAAGANALCQPTETWVYCHAGGAEPESLPDPGPLGDRPSVQRLGQYAGLDGAQWPLAAAGAGGSAWAGAGEEAGALYVSRRVCSGGAGDRPRCSPASAPMVPAAAEAAEAAAAHSAAACWRGSLSAVWSAASPPARLSSGPGACSGSPAAAA